jgi:DNA (cytosine-5)-methyltransferase 1
MTPRIPLTCIDLFCGCGGFSLGMIRAGFQVVAAIDFNRQAVETCRQNLGRRTRAVARPIPHVLLEDLTGLSRSSPWEAAYE